MKDRYSSERDVFMLEDDSGRIKLTGGITSAQVLVTGTVVAVLGTQRVGGEIEVEEFGFADFPPQTPHKPGKHSSSLSSFFQFQF